MAGFNPNTLSDADYWAMYNSPNLLQTVAYGLGYNPSAVYGGFNPNAMTDMDYWNYVNMYAGNYAPQVYNPPQSATPAQAQPQPQPEPATMPATVPSPYPPQVPQQGYPGGAAPFIIPPVGWAPVS